MIKKRKGIYLIGIFILLIAMDQWTKWVAILTLKGKEPVILIKNLLEFHYQENHGAAFGALQGKRFFILLMTIAILAVLVMLYKQTPKSARWYNIKLLMIMLGAGSIGNMIDRIIFGYVIDFMYIKAINSPVFNFADMYLILAIIMLAVLFLFFYRSDEEDEDVVLEILQEKKDAK